MLFFGVWPVLIISVGRVKSDGNAWVLMQFYLGLCFVLIYGGLSHTL
jgi:hypothetical protein